MDGDQGTVKVTGRVNPSTLLGVLEKYGRHAEVKYIKFDGEVVERSPHYYGEYGHGYDPYGMDSSYPLLGCPQHQWYPTSLNFFPPPPPPPPGPPPPPRLHPLASYQVPPPPPPPIAPYWGPPPCPYGPSPLGPIWPPPPPSHGPRGGVTGQNKKVVKEQNHCQIM